MLPSTISRIVGDFPSGPENSQAFLTLRVLWVIKSTVRSGAAASHPIPATHHSRNLTRDSPGDAPAPGPSLKRAFETLLRRVWHRGGGRGKQASKKERDGERERSAPSSHLRLLLSNKKGVPSPDDENWNCWARHCRSLAPPARLSGCFSPLIVIPNAAAADSVGRPVGRSDDIPSQLGTNSQSILASFGPQRSFFLSLLARSPSRSHA